VNTPTNTTNIFTEIPKDLSNEIFENIIKNDNVTIERIISLGHTSPPTGWYDQDRNEWIIVLKGSAKIVLLTPTSQNETTTTLSAGDHINIPAHTQHKVIWTTAESETIWLAIHY